MTRIGLAAVWFLGYGSGLSVASFGGADHIITGAIFLSLGSICGLLWLLGMAGFRVVRTRSGQ